MSTGSRLRLLLVIVAALMTMAAGPVDDNEKIGKKTPVIAIIIDDCGESEKVLGPFLKIDAPISFSILTSSSRARQVTAMLTNAGRDLWAHVPMEPNNPSAMKGGGYLTTSMDDETLLRTLKTDLAIVNGAKGINNHTGSRLTRDVHRMDVISEFLAKNGLLFIDSRTDSRSVALKKARERGVCALPRDVFLDDRNDTRTPYENLLLLEKKAVEKGYALGIGHPSATTADAIDRFVARPELSVGLVSATHLIEMHCRPQTPQNHSE